MIQIKWCSLVNLFNVISKMWVLHILRSIYLWNSTFSDIQLSLWTISSKTLSSRLKELQEEWFISREIISEQPIKIKYSLTEKWKNFSNEVDKLWEWAKINGY